MKTNLNKEETCFTLQTNTADTVITGTASSASAVLKLTDSVSCVNWDCFEEWSPWSGSNKCPKCGSSHIEVNNSIVLTTYPAQSQLRCKDCGYLFGSGILSADKVDNTSDATDKSWQRDQSILNIPKVGDWPPSPQVGDWPPYSWQETPEPPSYPDIGIPRKDSPVGWICPKCGRCYAPHVSGCKHCNESSIKITY